jgi:hypothetical protein
VVYRSYCSFSTITHRCIHFGYPLFMGYLNYPEAKARESLVKGRKPAQNDEPRKK